MARLVYLFSVLIYIRYDVIHAGCMYIGKTKWPPPWRRRHFRWISRWWQGSRVLESQRFKCFLFEFQLHLKQHICKCESDRVHGEKEIKKRMKNGVTWLDHDAADVIFMTTSNCLRLRIAPTRSPINITWLLFLTSFYLLIEFYDNLVEFTIRQVNWLCKNAEGDWKKRKAK